MQESFKEASSCFRKCIKCWIVWLASREGSLSSVYFMEEQLCVKRLPINQDFRKVKVNENTKQPLSCIRPYICFAQSSWRYNIKQNNN